MLWINFITKGKFFHHFQPIVNLENRTIEGFEALFRSPLFSTVEEAYQLAKKKRRLYELDVHSVQKAVRTFAESGQKDKGQKLFLNIYPSTLLHAGLVSVIKDLIGTYPFLAGQLVFEMVENERIDDLSGLQDVLKLIRQAGIRIAVDDFGKGPDNMNRTIEIDADYIKLDRYFSIDLRTSEKKQAYVAFLIRFCEKFHTKLIFEGLETAKDIHYIREMGIHYAQGYALGRPHLLGKAVRGHA
ncbi:EAL domain-containing protein [Sporolactobacillus sp. Y61]|uniref:EAL domain-containing protein n=1 Tax=Sporolactobacillus sp. Y61 TaxID=3160863 RepID=A0AAU8IBC1_9BACL